MGKNKFKTGDIIVLVNPRGMGARRGAKAVVHGYWNGYIRIHWLDSLANNQMDGGYCEEDFNLYEREWD